MPGLIVDVMVEKGQELNPGDPVVVLEAMKVRVCNSCAIIVAIL